MVDLLSASLGVLQIVVQLGAVYLAYRLISLTGTFVAWSLVIVALVLMTVRRITALMIQVNMIPALGGSIQLVDTLVLPLSISILLFAGVYGLVKTFERQIRKS
jgi:hypothetical protein